MIQITAYHRNFIYRNENVKVPRSSRIYRESIIGSDTCFGENCYVSKSIIRPSCTIDNNVRIENSFLWDQVRIEDNVIIKNAILCDNVLICEGSNILNGGILSFGTRIGNNTTLASFVKVTTRKQLRERNSSVFGNEALQDS